MSAASAPAASLGAGSDDAGPDGPASDVARFLAGGARRYWLFLRLLLLAGVVGALLAALFLFMLMPMLAYVGARNWEQPYLFLGAMVPVALAVAFWLASLLLDLARVRAIRLNERRAWRVFGGTLRFVWRNIAATLAVGLLFAFLTALAFAVYFAISSAVVPKSWIAILLVMVWQQALSLTRTALRVSMLAAEVELVAAREPVPMVPAPSEPSASELPPSERPSSEPPSPELPMTL